MTTVALPQAVRQTRERLTALLADRDPDAARGLAALVASRPANPTVVVVGETNRGKSSLVNALLAKPGLSPVEADVATGTYLVFGPSADEWRARACYPGTLPPVEFDIAELPAWSSADGEPPDGQLPPRYIEVAGPVPLLARLTLVDTPGVGGLDSKHGELAAAAAAGATALLFVIDASSPFSSGELAFLHDVADRVETVVFALTKIDAFRGWREIQDADRALLAKHAPRFADAPFYPVSSRMFERAAEVPTPDAAAMLREKSGIGELRTAMQELVVGRSMMLAEANALRALDTALAGLEAHTAAECRTLSAGAADAEALRARRDELAATRRSATRGWQVKLRGEVQRARMESGHEVSRRMRDVQSWFRQAIDSAGRRELAGLPAQVDSALQLASGQLSVALAQRLDRVAEVVLDELFSAEERALVRAQFAQDGAAERLALRPPDRRVPTAEDKLLVFMGMTGGFGAARVAALPLAGLGVAVLNPIVLPVTIVIGLGAGWWMARTRKHSSDKQHMKQWLTEAIADARSTMDQLVAEQLIEAEQQLSLALDEALAKRIEAIETELRDVDRAMKLADGERATRLTVAGRQLTEIQDGRNRVERLLAEIRALRDSARAENSQAGSGNPVGLP